MRRFWALAAASTGLLAAAMALTLPTPLGAPLWHHNLAFAVTLAGAALAWPLLQRRRVVTLLLLWTGIVATVTGFVMLYTIDFPRKEWITWWHTVSSFALLLAFLAHWLHNHPRLLTFTQRLLAQDRAVGWTLVGAWTATLAVGAWTWALPDARALFTRENYLYLGSWAVFVGVAATYGVWLAFRAPPLRARLADPSHRNRARAVVDASLFLANWAALLTGFALLWWGGPLRAGDLKYVSKWWHTATSVAFVALVALHAGFNARILAAHARRVDAELGPKNP